MQEAQSSAWLEQLIFERNGSLGYLNFIIMLSRSPEIYSNVYFLGGKHPPNSITAFT